MAMAPRTIASVPSQSTSLANPQVYSPSPIILAGLFCLPSLLLLTVLAYHGHRILKRRWQIKRLERMWQLDLSQRRS